MQFTNLIFVIAIVFIMSFGMLYLFSDVTNRYSTPNSVLTSKLNQTLLNQTMYDMNAMVNASISQTKAAVPSSDASLLSAMFGYLAGALTAAKTLLAMPAIVLALVSASQEAIGFFVPQYVFTALTLAIEGIVLIGILYFLLKVK